MLMVLESRRLGVGLDARIANKLYGGVEVSARDLDVPDLTPLRLSEGTKKQKEQLHRTYLYWLPHTHWAIRGEFQYESYVKTPQTLALTRIGLYIERAT